VPCVWGYSWPKRAIATVKNLDAATPARSDEIIIYDERRSAVERSRIAQGANYLGSVVLTNDELAERYGADPGDIELARQTLASRGLEVTTVDAGSRRVKVAGTLGELASAFGTTLQQVSSPGQGRRSRRHLVHAASGG